MSTLPIASSSTVAFCPNSPSSLKSSFHGFRIQQVCPIRTPRLATATPRPPPLPVAMMAKRDEELKEIRAKTTEEIEQDVQDLKGDLLMLHMGGLRQYGAPKEFSPEFRRMKKKIARMLTVRREREIEDGISKRLSRKIDKQWKRSVIPRPPASLIKAREKQAAEAAEAAAEKPDEEDEEEEWEL